MKIQLIRLISAFIAGGIVMIIHEFPKAFIYKRLNTPKGTTSKHNIYKLHHYIDPIGLLLCVTNQAGFSKPYMYRIKDQKTNMILGVTGFVSLAITFLVSISILKFGVQMNRNFSFSEADGILQLFAQCLVTFISLISITMFLVNLFPVSTFDMGLCIAGRSTSKYFAIIKNDYLIKMVLILVILFQIISSISTLIMSSILSI